MDIDPRGPRFGALITAVVFVIVLITGSVWLLAAQALVFAAGAFLGMRRSPYGLLYRWLVRPRLGPPAELEAEMPPRFAQAIGPAAIGLVAAFLNGVFGLCLGCEMYLLIRRIWPGRQVLIPAESDKEVPI